jgi:Zn-finger protein
MVHEEAKELISKRKELIKKEWDHSKTDNENLSRWSFESRSKTHPKECPCYSGQPCHTGEVNCFLCFCPEYDLSKEEGGCKRKGNGKWFFHENLPAGKIWDCSECEWPHRADNIKKHLKQLLE